MKKFFTRLFSFFNTIQGKIAFYPTVVAFLGFIFAFLMMYLEELGISKKVLDVFPRLILEDGDTALTLISVCIGGLISMMVFSFSMVMLLLSQASSNFSPRLLPGLISDKKNQIILGTYLATILYLIFTLFAIEPEDKKYSLPGVSILLGIVLVIFCLASFIYFVHNMSQSIQINNILDTIYGASKERLHHIIGIEKGDGPSDDDELDDTDGWFQYSTNKSGYFQNISIKNILVICEKKNLKIKICIPKGFFVLQHVTFIQSEQELDEETLNEILSNINFSRAELVEDNYILAFKQITEIALKAMSPGINDPGTAVNAIDYLTELFALRMLKKDSGILKSKSGVSLNISIVSFENLLSSAMAALRTYCKHDPILVQKLVWMLLYLKEQKPREAHYTHVVKQELELLKEDAKDSLTNKSDWQRIEKMWQNA